MAAPRIKRDGDTWAFSWDDHDVAMGIERLKERSDGLRAEITVESGLAGRVVGPVDLNVLSSESQTRFANACAKRVNGLSPDMWHALIVQVCAVVAKQYREATPCVDLSSIQEAGPIEYMVAGLIPAAETTVMYGDGESVKSLLALRIAFSVALGAELPWGGACRVGNVLYLDWETNASTVAQRLRRVALGECSLPPTIHYRQCFRSLSDELPHVKEEISKKQITLVIVDSIGFAASGALVEDETARSAMNALRSMSPATRLVVAHVSNETARQTSGKSRPFGSAFFWNGMRSGFEVRRSEEQTSDNVIDLGIYHWKSNDGRHLKPFGLSVMFDTRNDGILFEKAEIQDTPDLAARTSMSTRIRQMLRRGAMDTNAIAEVLDIKPNAARVVLGRISNVRVVREGGGKGNVALWGLTEE